MEHPRNSADAGIVPVLKDAFKDFGDDQCTTRAAALSYYTVFALPPLLILLIRLAGLLWSPATVEHSLETQFAGLVGPSGAQTIRGMISSGRTTGHGLLATVLGIAGLLFGATGAFLSLQDALNKVWEVEPKAGGMKGFIGKRLLSFGMLLGVAFLLVVSLAVTAALSALGGAIGSGVILQSLTFVVSLAVLAALFAAIFRFLPDAKIAWRDALIGGAATAVFFELGKFVIGLYLGHRNPGSAFGAASALAVILVWVYYAGMLVLFGAEFTQHYADMRGRGIRPREGAVHTTETRRVATGSR